MTILILLMLMVGILRGRDFIIQSRLSTHLNEMIKIKNHLLLFKDRYGTWPSDITMYECHSLGWGSTCSARKKRTGNIHAGDSNYFWYQLFTEYPKLSTGEFYMDDKKYKRFHLDNWHFKGGDASISSHNMLEASYSTHNIWGKKLGNRITTTAGLWNSYIKAGAYSAAEAKYIDEKIDDGIAYSGAIYGIGAKCSKFNKNPSQGTNSRARQDYGVGVADPKDDHACGLVFFMDEW